MTFLESIAKKYATEYQGPLADVCFVFPGKRASSFFLRYLRRHLGRKTTLLPAVTTISDLVERLSNHIVNSRIDQLCLLYSLYRRKWESKGQAPMPFDRFISLGETMLSDFNDIEMFRVNADALYHNVSSLKNISSNYLTEEQMKIMREYFGYSDIYQMSDKMWRHYEGNSTKGAKQKFLSLWDAMGELYSSFCDELEQKGFTFSGRAYTLALNKLTENPAVLPYSRVVMVGFNALTTVEFMIFDTLAKTQVTLPDGSKQPLGDFYWDCTGVPLSSDDNIGRHFIKRNLKHFKSIYDIRESDCDSLPYLETIVSPSGVGQAKITGELIKKIMQQRHSNGETDDAEVAVVLPDENMLLPMLYSLPRDVTDVNITMGYPFKLTTVATFVSLIEALQWHIRFKDNESHALTSDVKSLLLHPLTTLLIDTSRISQLLALIEERRRITVPLSLLSADCEFIFKPLGPHATGESALDYMLSILKLLGDTIQKNEAMNPRTEDEGINHLEREHIGMYIEALQRVKDSFVSYQIKSGAISTLRLAGSILCGETVRFVGKPLKGLQILGPLETRCIDFKTVIIPSMNERIYPRKLHNKSFIPAVVRHGFGMATTRFQEAIFTYYFYRMISRANKVYMLYDSRNEGLHSGSPSRFILQLENLYAKGKVKHKSYGFDLNAGSRSVVEIEKTEEIMQELNKYITPGSAKGLSASSLNKYISCPLQFYLQTIRNVNKETSPKEGLQGNDLGSVIHKTLEIIYTELAPEKILPYEVTRELLDKVNDSLINKYIIQAVNKEIYNNKSDVSVMPESSVAMMVPHISSMVKRVLDYDKTQTPFYFIGAEQQKTASLMLPSGKSVNFKYIIDRIDSKEPVNSTEPLRIVDYKSGKFDIETEDWDQMFKSDHPAELVQLLLYAILLHQESGGQREVEMAIYDVAKINIEQQADNKPVKPKIEGEKLTGCIPYQNRFLHSIDKVISEMLDKEVPFKQAPEGSKACTYCPFREAVCRC